VIQDLDTVTIHSTIIRKSYIRCINCIIVGDLEQPPRSFQLLQPL